jgi:hypothetical protein
MHQFYVGQFYKSSVGKATKTMSHQWAQQITQMAQLKPISAKQ